MARQRSNQTRPANGDLRVARGYWVAADTILWNIAGSARYTYELFFAPEGGLRLSANGISNGDSLQLTWNSNGPSDGILAQFPHLHGQTALGLAPADLARIPTIIKGQVAVQARDETGTMVAATSLQLAGALDALFAYAGDLGVSYAADVPTLRVWAPTACQVSLLRSADGRTAESTSQPMTLDGQTGVWSIAGTADWTEQYYLYEVEVYVSSTGTIKRNRVTDPYSVSLSTNSTRSQIVNLADSALAPAGWATLQKPPFAAPTEIVLYELHVRDFSIADPSVPAQLRGNYGAFTVAESYGMQHLTALADAGLTHVHLLPVFDIATLEEDRAKHTAPDFAQLASFAPDSDQQQALIAPHRDRDGFNWGYDPFHYTVPEGSYATDPEGATRIREFRAMVQALNAIGLRVVLDVVYNHTHAHGQHQQSVLDRIVPGYYHRLDENGVVEISTCCSNTATEHAMMQKLMLDSLRIWAIQYKIDGFRFDLMGHHMKANMLAVRSMLDGLTLQKDGVDGSQIYVYGEGWDFGEVQHNGRGINASQLNMGGSGIGTFNDRLRDAVRGGGAFSGFRQQGFISGLLHAPNAAETRPLAQQHAALLAYSDLIRLGLAGNLKQYQLVNAAGATVAGDNINYNGEPAGYTLAPSEQIVYVGAHDNETLFDTVQLKAPADLPMRERVRMHNLGLSLVALAQGVPFFHAGDDLLRSKSLDCNSYNSGDWFNRIDWRGQESTWGAGLPPAADNAKKWAIMKPLLADPKLKPTPADIAAASAHFREMLQIRRSSPLFRLRTAAQVQAKVGFGNSGPTQIPGVIVLVLHDIGDPVDPIYQRIVVVFNCTSATQTVYDASLTDTVLALHPLQAHSADSVVQTATFASGTFTIPGRTAAVFVQTKAIG